MPRGPSPVLLLYSVGQKQAPLLARDPEQEQERVSNMQCLFQDFWIGERADFWNRNLGGERGKGEGGGGNVQT